MARGRVLDEKQRNARRHVQTTRRCHETSAGLALRTWYKLKSGASQLDGTMRFENYAPIKSLVLIQK